MQAVAIDEFGGVDVLKVQTVPVPKVDPDDVLIRIEWAGVGEWDPFEREGGYAEMTGATPTFPLVLGSEGAGTIAAVGDNVKTFKEGDRVYTSAFLNRKGGLYAEYAVVPANMVVPVSDTLTMEQAAVVTGIAITALRGLEDVLAVKSGETVMVFGASGGVGHMAVQLAKAMGARVFAVASGEDGVALAKRIGADAVADGKSDDPASAAREFAPNGLDVALLTAGGPAADQALAAMRSTGRIAYPNGVEPEPRVPKGIQSTAFNADPDPEILARMHRRVSVPGFDVHIHKRFPLAEVANAHRAVEKHHLGKIVLKVTPGETRL